MTDRSHTSETDTIIGWRELVDLPEWDLHAVRAKADTGARSSALDVDCLEELPGGIVRFEVVARRGPRERRRVVEAPVVRRAHVRSSLGEGHERLFVETTVRVACHEFRTEIGLVSRASMISRMLLGRRSLEGAFLVDPARCYLHGRRRRPQPQPRSDGGR